MNEKVPYLESLQGFIQLCPVVWALDKGNLEAFDLGIKQMAEDIAALPETSVSIKEKWREIKSIQQGDTLKSFAAATRNALEHFPIIQHSLSERRSYGIRVG